MTMIELNKEKLQKAIDTARAERKSLLVKLTGVTRRYTVVNKSTQVSYTVQFDVKKKNKNLPVAIAKLGNMESFANTLQPPLR